MSTPRFFHIPQIFRPGCQALIVITRTVFRSSSLPLARFSGTGRHSQSLSTFPNVGRGSHSRFADPASNGIVRALVQGHPKAGSIPLPEALQENPAHFDSWGRGLPCAGLARTVLFLLLGNAGLFGKPAPVDGTDMIAERDGAFTAHLR